MLQVGAGETLNSRPANLFIQEFVGYWEFEDNADDSINANNGTTTGSPTYTTGKVGRAINLDGSNDLVTLPDGIADTEDITITAWVNWDGGSNWQRIFDFGTSTDQYLFLTPTNGSVMRFAIKNCGSEQVVDTTPLSTGQWVHLAVVLKGDVATLYVDGQAAATNAAVTINPRDFCPTINYIGDSQWSADPLFNGRVDDFQLYNYALRGSEIWDIWGQSTDNAPVFSDDPIVLSDGTAGIAYTGQTLAGYASDPDNDPLTFSKISGPDWLDVAADGTLSGTPLISDVGANSFTVRVTDSFGAGDDAILNISVIGLGLLAHYEFENNADDSAGSNDGTATGSPTYTTGQVGQAINLDAVDDYVTLPAGVVNSNDITIAAWVNWDGGDVWQRIFDFGSGETQYMFLTPSSYSNTLRFAITTSGNGSEQRIETSGLSTGTWTHVAITLNGDLGTLYVNGTPAATNSSMTINPTDFNAAINYVGASQFSSDPLFDGRIDDFRIYNFALSETQIAAVVAGNTPPSFTTDPISNTGGIELTDYAGNSLVTYADDAEGIGTVTFSKDTGPDWLMVASDGTLSGVPTDSISGTNTFTVRVTDAGGEYDTATMTIDVANVYSGVLGVEDLLGLAAQWLMTDCVDTPACDGADLSGDTDVDLADLWFLSHNWLANERLQLHLPFDETSGDTANDQSIYLRNGLLVNSPVWSSGTIGGAIDFDGTDDYVDVTGYPGILSNTSRTCCAWIKTAVGGDILGWGSNESAGAKWRFQVTATGLLSIQLQGGKLNSDTGGLLDDAWHHVAVVVPETVSPATVGDMLLYIDGSPVSTTATTPEMVINTSGDGQVKIGVFEYNGAGLYYFDGLIDDVRIYNTALTQQQIQEITELAQ